MRSPRRHRLHSPGRSRFQRSLSVKGSVAITVTTSLGVVSAWKSTVTSTSFRRAGPKGARRVICASLVEQKQNSQSPSLSRQLNTPLPRYSCAACTSTGNSTSAGTGSGKAPRTRLSRSQKAASLSVSPTGR